MALRMALVPRALRLLVKVDVVVVAAVAAVAPMALRKTATRPRGNLPPRTRRPSRNQHNLTQSSLSRPRMP
jgi:hypothetical protein